VPSSGTVTSDLMQLLGWNIEHVQLPALLKHDARLAFGTRAQAGEVDVVVGKVGDLAELAAAGVVGPDVPAAGLSRGRPGNRSSCRTTWARFPCPSSPSHVLSCRVWKS